MVDVKVVRRARGATNGVWDEPTGNYGNVRVGLQLNTIEDIQRVLKRTEL